MFLNALKQLNEIIPRKALSRGHTMAFNLYKCIDEEKIKYIDYTIYNIYIYDYTKIYCLNPYVQKYGIFPKGHPEILIEINNILG